MNKCLFFGLILLASACNNRKKPAASQTAFSSKQVFIDCDTTITSIAWHNGRLLACQENGQLIIFDSNYQRLPRLETAFKNIKVQAILAQNGSVFAYINNIPYLINDNLERVRYHGKPDRFQSVLYEDSAWSISACCFGEFGGSVFFRQQATDSVWSYPVTCASEVIPFRGGYWVCKNLAHLSKRTEYTWFPSPQASFNLTRGSDKQDCNWWVLVDSLDNFYSLPKQNGIKGIEGPEDALTVLNFTDDDSLYTIVANDSMTYVHVLRKDTLPIKDTLFKHPLNFHYAKTQTTTAGSFTLLSLTGGSPFAALPYTGNSAAILVRKGRNFDLLLKRTTQ